MTHPNAPDTPPKPTWVDGPPSAPSESPWSDDPEGLCECGLDPWLAERLWLDGETAEVKRMWLLLSQDWAFQRALLVFCQTIQLEENA